MRAASDLAVRLLLCAGIAWAGAGNAAAQPAKDGRQIAIAARPLAFDPGNRARVRFGKLMWRGGLELSSRDKIFGGLSGLLVSRGGERMIAVSDQGQWLTARIGYEAGRLVSVSNVRMGPLLGANGRPLAGKALGDAESVAADDPAGPGGAVLVSFERAHRIMRYDFANSGMAARPTALPLPGEARAMSRNKGLEAVARMPGGGPFAGRLVAISERFLDSEGNIIGWLIGARGSDRFAVRRIADFDITDIAFLPGGDLVTLERRFTPLSGAGLMLRRIRGDAIRPGGVLDGEVLLRTGQTLAIDNMEGLSVHRTSGGETRLTLISDDNFNIFQRTLIMQFAIAD